MRLSAVVALVAAAGSAHAGIVLSQYMGAPSGSATSSSYAPYTIVNNPAEYGGFGIDTAGAFAVGAQIEFTNHGPFQYGIGAHPNSSLSFVLDAFRGIENFDTFKAIIGIDTASHGGGGATFEVFIDGNLVYTQGIASVTEGGTSIAIAIPDDAAMLTLNTTYLNPGSNHAAWADARFVPAPASTAILACAALAHRRRRSPTA